MRRLSPIVLLALAILLGAACSTNGEGGGPDGGGGSGGSAAGGSTGGACASVTTLEACDARSDCHALFEDPGNCRCAALGCCARFSRCADGDRALCTSGAVLCDALTPHCEGPYVVSYTDFCYDGCVRATECLPPTP